jgi:hypothetical protein
LYLALTPARSGEYGDEDFPHEPYSRQCIEKEFEIHNPPRVTGKRRMRWTAREK